jgi:hypothetical protein
LCKIWPVYITRSPLYLRLILSQINFCVCVRTCMINRVTSSRFNI